MAAFLIFISLTTGTTAFIMVPYQSDDTVQGDHVIQFNSNRSDTPPLPPPFVSREFPELANLSFHEDFVIPPPLPGEYPLVHRITTRLNGTHGKQMLEAFHLYWADNSTEVTVFEDHVRLRDETRFTTATPGTGQLHYREEKPKEEDGGALVSDIEAKSSLLNGTEALGVAVSWLKAHNLYNSSWELKRSGSIRSGGSIANPGERVREYHFYFSPVVDGWMVHGTPEPRLWIDVTPFGQVIEVDACVGELRVGPDTSPMTFPDPLDMLVHLNENLGMYACPFCVRNATIISIVPAYGVGRQLDMEDDPVTGWPCWYVTLYYNNEVECERGLCL